MMLISIGADHAGFETKEMLKNFLLNKKHTLFDVGAFTYEPGDDYPDFAKAVALDVVKGKASKGIIICGTGIGSSIAANKIKGIRASVCSSIYDVRMGRKHNDLNVLCLGSRALVDRRFIKRLVLTFLSTAFTEEERHRRRLEKISEIEKNERP